ncbi:MAG TPA: hypothetical protein VEU96_02635 [Bryobacteraceae bacterium]|nr:hypothetical protein [Bryobacteraceae bacterium]
MRKEKGHAGCQVAISGRLVISAYVYGILFAILASTSVARSSTVYSSASDQRIVIAADSLIVERVSGKTSRLCKIMQSDSYFFAAVGDYLVPGFNVFKIITQALGGAGTFTEKFSTLESSLALSIPVLVESVRKNDREQYQKWLGGSPPVEIVLATVEHGQLILATWGQVLKADGRLDEPYKSFCRSAQAGSCDHVSGSQFTTRRYMEEHPIESGHQRLHFPTGYAIFSVELEIEGNRAEVGPPISALEITNQRVRWIPGFQGICPAIVSLDRTTRSTDKKK